MRMQFTFSLEGLEPLNRAPYVFSPLQLEWLTKLESGEYKQGQGVLRSSTDEYCCLGVLAELAGCDKKLASVGTAYEYRPKDSTDGQWEATGFLPFETRRDAGLNSQTGRFSRPVMFPGVNYGHIDYVSSDVEKGHGSLAAMNDVRMLPDGEGGLRAFTFAEIAAYIRSDPWNVFTELSAPAHTAEIPLALAA